MINNNYTGAANGSRYTQGQQSTGRNERQSVRNDRQNNSNQSPDGQGFQRPSFGHGNNGGISGNILSLVQQLLALLQQCNQPPPPPPAALKLSTTQDSNLKQLLGFTEGSPVGVQVLDNDGDGQVSVGDTAIVSGGITGGEIQRRTLNEQDVRAINTVPDLPADFLANQAKWEQASNDPLISNQYTLQQTCFCPPDYTRPMNITEQNGKITQATYVDNGEAVPVYVLDGLLTMDERFEQLQDAYESGADRIDVTYDEKLGYPTSVFIDRSFMIADEEVIYNINNLQQAIP